MITIISATLSISGYKTVSSSTDNAREAIPVINISSNLLNIAIEINPLKEIPDYVFEVSNYDEQKESEVSMEYNLQIKTSNSLPLEFEIYNYYDDNKTNLLVNNSTNKIKMDVGQENNKYGLKIKWKENQKNYLYSQEIDYIQLILNSEQID